jgi:uncharacterized protein (TIGR00369 family)
VATDISPPIEHQAPLSQTEKIREAQEGLDEDPFYSFLGVRVEGIGDGTAKVGVDLSPQLMSGDGERHVNGGVMTAMSANAAGIVAYDVGDPTTTIIRAQDSHITHLGQPGCFPITAEAQLVHRGKHMIVTETIVADGGGYPLERMSITWGVVPLPNQGGNALLIRDRWRSHGRSRQRRGTHGALRISITLLGTRRRPDGRGA